MVARPVVETPEKRRDRGRVKNTAARVSVLCAAVIALSLGCWLHKPTPITPTPPDGGFADASPGTVLADCSDAAIHAAGLQLLPDVETDLALTGAASVAALEALTAQLAVQVGLPLALAEVGCLVEYVINEAQAHFLRTADSIESLKVANGHAYLARHPIVFVTDAGTP
jgi:hypothetical protein